MSFTINPCKACTIKYKDEGCDVNSMNNCLVDTASAFSGIPSNNFIKQPARENWQECMADIIHAKGKNLCDLRLDMAPVWNQTPHYFPGNLVETKDPEKAKELCIEMCKGDLVCIENCNTDFNAVETVSNEAMTVKKSNTNDSKGKNSSIVFGVIMFLFNLLVIFFLLYYLYLMIK